MIDTQWIYLSANKIKVKHLQRGWKFSKTMCLYLGNKFFRRTSFVRISKNDLVVTMMRIFLRSNIWPPIHRLNTVCIWLWCQHIFKIQYFIKLWHFTKTVITYTGDLKTFEVCPQKDMYRGTQNMLGIFKGVTLITL